MARLERNREVPAPVGDSPLPSAPRSARLALSSLVALAIASPWALGAVTPVGVRVVTAAALVTALGVAAHQAGRGGPWLPRVPLWPAAVLLGVGALQLAPLPAGVHARIAPASAAVWHPPAPSAAALLGDAWRPISIDPGATRAWLGMTVGLVGLALLAAPALGQRARLTGTAWIVVGAGAALAVYAVVARATFGPLLYGRIAVPTVAPFGPFVNKNHFAGYVEMAAVVAVGLGRGLSRQAAGARDAAGSLAGTLALAAFGAAAAMAMAILLSLSRGGALGLVSGLAVFAIVDLGTSRRPHPLARVLVPVGLAFLLAALAVALPGEVHDRLLSTRWRDDASASLRLEVWKDSVRAWRASSIAGQGLGAFASALPRFKTTAGAFRVEHPENEPLELAVEGGAVALLSAGAGLALLLARAVRAIRGHRDRVLRGIVAGAIGGAIALLVHGLVDFNLRIPSNALLFLVILALAAAPLGSAPASTAGRWTVLAGLTLAALAAWWPAPSSGPALPEARVLALKAARSPEASASLLRLAQADRAVRGYVARRPADPEGWLLAAWVAGRSGRPADAAALAGQAVALDPERGSLSDAARALAGE